MEGVGIAERNQPPQAYQPPHTPGRRRGRPRSCSHGGREEDQPARQRSGLAGSTGDDTELSEIQFGMSHSL